MFFYLAKILWFIAQPSAALLLLLLAGLLLIGIGRVPFGGAAVLIATAGLLVCGFTQLGVLLLLPLEQRFPPPDLKGPVTGIIVLGGGIDQHNSRIRGGFALTDAGDRLTEAVILARRYPEARLVFTGGSADLQPDGTTEAGAAAGFFRAIGIPDARITTESESRDTAENARLTKALVEPKPGETWLLVTSAWHMPRAVGCFRAAGWDIVPYPVDYRTYGWSRLGFFSPRPSLGLTQVDLAVKEWIGLVAYRLAGRTDALFPAP